jgi:hypothetical protein
MLEKSIARSLFLFSTFLSSALAVAAGPTISISNLDLNDPATPQLLRSNALTQATDFESFRTFVEGRYDQSFSLNEIQDTITPEDVRDYQALGGQENTISPAGFPPNCTC